MRAPECFNDGKAHKQPCFSIPFGNPEGKTMRSGEIGGPDVFGVAPRSLDTGDYSIVASNGKSREGHVLR